MRVHLTMALLTVGLLMTVLHHTTLQARAPRSRIIHLIIDP
jgi:hypothetical protein